MKTCARCVVSALLLSGLVGAFGCSSDESTATSSGSSTGFITTGASNGGAGGNGGAAGATESSSVSSASTGGSAAGGAGGAAGGAGGTTASSGGAPPCQTNADCNDNFSCTVDACSQGVCVHAPDDTACGDGVYCNGAEKCDPAHGAPGTGCASSGTPCDDGIACTVDTCDEATKSCAHTPNDALCNNGIACDGVETCNALMGCISTGPVSCDDGVACTDDFCDQVSGSCKHVPNDNNCSDGIFCNGSEKCDAVNGCQPGVPVDCNDNIACTADLCNEALNKCDHFPNDGLCDDGNYCNGAEVCQVGIGCQAGSPIVCNDGLSCTKDTCDTTLKKCVFTPDNTACNDGLYCDGTETCDPSGPAPSGCKSGTPVSCPSDGIACTIDACDETTKTCTHTASNNLCPAGDFCVPAAGGCTTGKPCSTNAECDDGNACNGVETCNGVSCQPGTPVNCDDNIACTIDSCNPSTGACSHAPNNDICNDGFNCNGIETCNAQTGCVSTGPVNCDDGVQCTFDACQDPQGTCTHTAQNFLCDDGNPCNGTETCTATGCKAGTAVVCNDGIACTVDTCNPLNGQCVFTPNNDACPCGQTCNPTAGGCGNFCNIKTCQGHVYACGDCIDNDGDCKIDDVDPDCLGPCDNTENSYYGGIPGQNNSPCKSDCYFDQDTGSGNDDCYWSHKCDPLEVPPNYPPEGSQCAYNPNANIAGYSGTCATAFQSQSSLCLSYCGPLVPNGCDCFGCCVIPGAPTPVWLGSENPSGTGSCTIATLSDPTMCKPCTQVPACLNTCEHCELCVGKTTLPPDCNGQQTCPPGVQLCGLPTQPLCPAGYFCNTGCCEPVPQ